MQVKIKTLHETLMMQVRSDDDSSEEMKMSMALEHIKYILQVSLVNDESLLQDWHSYMQDFKKANPMISNLIAKIRSLIPDGDLDMPDKQKTFFNNYIELFPATKGKINVA